MGIFDWISKLYKKKKCPKCKSIMEKTGEIKVGIKGNKRTVYSCFNCGYTGYFLKINMKKKYEKMDLNKYPITITKRIQ
jgi:RNase P subunit RPR2